MCDWQTSDSNILHSRLLAARVYCAMTDRDIEVLDIRDKNKRISHLNKTGCLVGVLMHCVFIVIHKCYLIFCRKMFTIFYWSCVPFISRWSICLCLCNDIPCFCLFLWAWRHLLVFFYVQRIRSLFGCAVLLNRLSHLSHVVPSKYFMMFDPLHCLVHNCSVPLDVYYSSTN